MSDLLLGGGIQMALLCILSPIAASFFVLSQNARQYLIIMLIFTGIYVFAFSVNTIVVCGIFPAGGDARYDAVSVFFASWCFALPPALLGTFVKLPRIYPGYKKYLRLNKLTRKEG